MNDRFPEIEGYRILELLGQGGLGRVYLAESAAGRRVALKFLHERIDFRANEVRRLIREARVGSTLQHDNILPVFAIEPWHDSHVIVMEYVDGAQLGPWRPASEPPSALGERVLILASIADALEHAHARGVVHRDVKPANILVRRDGHPFLIDFGLARTVAVDSTVTATGSILGTPAYLPPESVAGAGQLDRRGDLYSLGVTLFEVASGTLPFQAPHLPELFQQILHEEPPRLPPGTPHARALEPIVRRALEKRPADRYGSAAELRDDLLRAVRGLRPRTGQASRWVRRELRRIARRRLQLVLGVAGVLALLAGSLFLGLRSLERARARDELLRSGHAHLDRGELERALADFARVDEISASGYEGHLARAHAFAEFQMWERARAAIQDAEELGYRFGAGEPGAADLFLRGLRHFTDHRYAESEADLAAALERDPDQYRAYFVVSRLLLRQERRAEARVVLETCRRNLKEVNPRHTAVSALIHVLDGDHATALDELRRLAGSADPPLWVHALLGGAHLSSYHEGAGALEDLRQALAEFTRAVELQPGDGYAWSQLGVVRFLGREHDQARRCAQRSVELDPRLEAGHRLLAILAANAGEWREAEGHLAAFAEETALEGLANTLRAQAAFELGREDLRARRYEPALAEAQECVERLPRHLGGWLLLGQVRWLLGQVEPALEAFSECRRQCETWKAPAEGWEPWVRTAEDVRRRNALDIEIGLLGTTVQLERQATVEEVGLARAALERLQDALAGGVELSTAAALNLAEALATGSIQGLRDCSWALELVEARNLYQEFAGRPTALATLAEIERSCR